MSLLDILNKMNREDQNELCMEYTKGIAEEAAKHSVPSPETRTALAEIKESFKDFSSANSADHTEIKESVKEIIRHQKHINGDVSDIKLWRARMEGLWAGASKSVSIVWIIIVLFFGSVLPLSVSIYFNNRSFSQIQEKIEAREIKHIEVGSNR